MRMVRAALRAAAYLDFSDGSEPSECIRWPEAVTMISNSSPHKRLVSGAAACVPVHDVQMQNSP